MIKALNCKTIITVSKEGGKQPPPRAAQPTGRTAGHWGSGWGASPVSGPRPGPQHLLQDQNRAVLSGATEGVAPHSVTPDRPRGSASQRGDGACVNEK